MDENNLHIISSDEEEDTKNDCMDKNLGNLNENNNNSIDEKLQIMNEFKSIKDGLIKITQYLLKVINNHHNITDTQKRRLLSFVNNKRTPILNAKTDLEVEMEFEKFEETFSKIINYVEMHNIEKRNEEGNKILVGRVKETDYYAFIDKTNEDITEQE